MKIYKVWVDCWDDIYYKDKELAFNALYDRLGEEYEGDVDDLFQDYISDYQRNKNSYSYGFGVEEITVL